MLFAIRLVQKPSKKETGELIFDVVEDLKNKFKGKEWSVSLESYDEKNGTYELIITTSDRQLKEYIEQNYGE